MVHSMEKELPTRKCIRLQGHDYSSAGAYFVTICVKDRHELLGEIVVGDAPPRVPHCILSEHGIFVEMQIRKISSIYPEAFVDIYTIMPNHVHMIVSITGTDIGRTHRGASPTRAALPRIVQSLKSITTKQFGLGIWQRSYHDHIIRDDADYRKIWQYIDENPQKWADDCYYTK